MSPAHRWQLLLWLVLLSAAGLAALVGTSLADAATSARAQAATDARLRLRDQALALRLWLRDPAALDLVEPGERFAVQGGRLLVPEQVGWLVVRPGPAPDYELHERLRQAQVAEFVEHDPAQAARILADWLQQSSEVPGRKIELQGQLAAAWLQQRQGDREAAVAWLQPVLDHLAGLQSADMANPAAAERLASALLLLAALDQPLPPWAASLAAALPSELAAATFARLAERGAVAPARELAAAAAAVQASRATLLLAQSLAPTLPAANLVMPGHGDRVLLWHGESVADPSVAPSGRGALVALARLPALLASAFPEVLVLHASEPEPPHEEVLPGRLWLAAPAALPTTRASTALVLAAGAAALLLILGSSLFLGARAMRRELQAMRARSEFLTGVTHELKTPVASIRLIAERLADDPVEPARQRDYFALLTAEAARLSMLIDNVLDLGQIERGERAYELTPLDLGELLQHSLAVFAPLAERAGMQLQLALPAEPLPAQADGGAISQALLAVLENARKYAAVGGRIEVQGQRRGNRLVLTVRDHGPGVPAEERSAIFQRFTRGRLHRHGSVPGIGLGLHLAQRIAVRHGGSLDCLAPDSGPGAVFRFEFPLTVESA